ncbi:hypothetical protein [Streptomyces sp. NPDC050560]|uniref:hypothetical protein n=1 Tax=Streptomyces sp. NPDC050560 TaxID=3365630 RepID=UPI0037B90C39
MGLFDWWNRRHPLTAGPPPAVIREEHQPAVAPGPGVRSCHTCDIRWYSPLARLRDTGELDRRGMDGDCRVRASWAATMGLTCSRCGLSVCRGHMGEPSTNAPVPQAEDYHCTLCAAPLRHG